MAYLYQDAAVYCGTYHKYNCGSIFGKWMKFADYADADEFFEACSELHKDEDDPGFMFQDFECFPEQYYSESMGHSLCERIYELINERTHIDEEQFEAYLEAFSPDVLESPADELIENASNRLVWHGNEDDYARDYLESCCVEVPPILECHIDYEGLGRVLLTDYYRSGDYYFA